MDLGIYTYLVLNLFTLSGPLARSFEPKIAYYKNWKALFAGITVTGAFFIVWDVFFTEWGVWGFNSRYLTGMDIINLPLEEWLFFLTIPYACVFIYEVLNYFVKKDLLGSASRGIAIVMAIALAILAGIFHDRAYTFTTFSLLSVFLLMHAFWFRAEWLGRFFLAWLVSIVPFLLINGILTGSFIDEQVVWYNDAENMGIRCFTIPVEDFFYGMLLLLMNVTIYERLRSRRNRNFE